MKKTYVKPLLEVMIIRTSHQLLAGSYNVSNREAQSDALSREYSWDDEY